MTSLQENYPVKWTGVLHDKGFRVTIPRQAVLKVLSETSDHLSAEDVYLEVHKKHPYIGLTTVYRTLNLLVRLNVVFRFDFGDNRARYELIEKEKGMGHHHHLVCSKCSAIIDYNDFLAEEVKFLEDIESGLSKKYNFEIKNHLIQFYGLCENCK
ncbi:MAG: transcriptional repressor [Pseudomonadota bacterium]